MAPVYMLEVGMEKICSNCKLWQYDKWIESYYGMGVGICSATGEDTFCSHPCIFCMPKDDVDE